MSILFCILIKESKGKRIRLSKLEGPQTRFHTAFHNRTHLIPAKSQHLNPDSYRDKILKQKHLPKNLCVKESLTDCGWYGIWI